MEDMDLPILVSFLAADDLVMQGPNALAAVLLT